MDALKPAPALPAPEGTPFEKFDRLFRAVVSVPKEPVEKKKQKSGGRTRKRARNKAAKK